MFSSGVSFGVAVVDLGSGTVEGLAGFRGKRLHTMYCTVCTFLMPLLVRGSAEESVEAPKNLKSKLPANCLLTFSLFNVQLGIAADQDAGMYISPLWLKFAGTFFPDAGCSENEIWNRQ